MADRDIFQSAETESEGENLCRNQRERAVYPDLDSIDCHAADQVPAVQVKVSLVAIESCGFPAVESIYLQELMGLD